MLEVPSAKFCDGCCEVFREKSVVENGRNAAFALAMLCAAMSRFRRSLLRPRLVSSAIVTAWSIESGMAGPVVAGAGAVRGGSPPGVVTPWACPDFGRTTVRTANSAPPIADRYDIEVDM